MVTQTVVVELCGAKDKTKSYEYEKEFSKEEWNVCNIYMYETVKE